MDIIHEKMKPGVFSPGIYDCYSNRQYHEHEGLSKSNLDQLHRTPAQRFGTAFHCAALEPVMFSAGYTVIPGDKRTKAVKEAWAEAEKSGKNVLTMEEFDAINGMCAALWSSKNAEVFLRPALSEYSVFTELNGVRVKCRPDAWNVG